MGEWLNPTHFTALLGVIPHNNLLIMASENLRNLITLSENQKYVVLMMEFLWLPEVQLCGTKPIYNVKHKQHKFKCFWFVWTNNKELWCVSSASCHSYAWAFSVACASVSVTMEKEAGLTIYTPASIGPPAPRGLLPSPFVWGVWDAAMASSDRHLDLDRESWHPADWASSSFHRVG